MLAWIGIVLGTVWLVYAGGGWWGIYSPYLRIATMAVATLALVAWAVVAAHRPSWRPQSALLPMIAASLGSLAISTVFSRVPRISAEYLGYAIVLAALYLLLVRLFAEPFLRRRLATLATMLFFVSAIAYLGQVALEWVRWWTLAGITIPPLRPGFFGLTYNNPSAALTMITLLGAPVVATFGSATRSGGRVVIVVAILVGAVALLSGSRAGWFALGTTSIVVALAWLAFAGNRAHARASLGRASKLRSVRVAAAAAGVMVLGLVVVLGPAILARVGEGGEDLRLNYALAAIRMFMESPLVGTGPGTWVIQRPHYTMAPEADYYIPHAHNVEVQTLAELGLVGVAAGILVALGVGRLFLDAIRSDDPSRRRWGWAGGFVLIYFVLHQVLDFYLNMPAFLFAAAIPVAYLDSAAMSVPSEGSFRRARSLNPAATRIGAALIAVSIAGLLLQEVPALRQAQATAAATARDWAAADGPAREAAAMDPEIGSYQLTAGLTASRVGDHAAAAAHFERVAIATDLPEAWLNLAAEQAATNRVAAALQSLRSALRLGYQRPAVAMPAGDLALRLGATGLATEAFAQALARAPSLAADPWWQLDARRQALFDDVVDAAIASEPEAGWELALMAGRTSEANAADLGLTTPGMVSRAWLGDTDALAVLRDACQARPVDASLLIWCARVTRHLGLQTESNAYRERVALISIGASAGAGELRVSGREMIGDQLPGGPADLWATYTYRRPAPWDILVPDLIYLALT